MLDTALVQLRFALSVGLGWPFSLRGLDTLIRSLQATRREFGPLDPADATAIHAPPANEATRRDLQLQRFRQQAVRAVCDTRYYPPVFAQLGRDPAKLTWEDIARLPPTSKAALQADAAAFVRRGVPVVFRTTTTGTTGRPTHLLFSAHEMALYTALGAINHLSRGTITDEDVVQINTSSRATLGNTCFAGACARVGALVYLVGLVDPGYSLDLLHEEQAVPGKARRPTVLSTYASYLGALVMAARERRWGPADFSLRRIAVGGEPVTAGLKRRAGAVFGPVQWEEGFGQTESWPATGVICPEGHLHFDASQSLLEVVDPATGAPTPPGQVGNLVLTALPPYREAQIILRYDSGDLVQTLLVPPTCALAGMPAVSNLLGKRALAVPQADGTWTTPRQILEALEGLDAVPLPARAGWWAVPGGVAVEVVVPDATPAVRALVGTALEAAEVPVRELTLHADAAELRRPYPWRGDLRETLFAPAPAPHQPVGATG